MPKLQILTSNFTAGEFSPRLRGRSDIEKFNASAELLRNVVILKQGGATIRPPLEYTGEVKVSSQTARVIAFVFSRVDAYLLEFGNLYMRVWRDGVYTGYEIATPYTDAQLADLDFSQGADTMIVTHDTVYPQRIRRFADTRWTIDNVPFKPAALGEVGHRSSTVNMTISATAVGAARTLTASAAFFLAGDIGRVMTWDGGEALITAVASSVSATATVTTAFGAATSTGPAWVLMGTPQTQITASAKDPVGAVITLTAPAAADTWRAADVGAYVEINGGLVRIDSITSVLIASGTIMRELLSTTATPSGAWVLKSSLWNATDGYPQTCTFYEQRLWFGNSRKYPQSKWGSRSGLYFDFTPGTADDSAVYKTVASDQVNPIQYLLSATSLITLGYGGEFESRGGVEKPITQLNMQIKSQSEWGADRVRPETVGKEILFVERGGKALRSLFPIQVEGFDSNDVSVYSEHLLADGVKCMSFERRPESVLWVATKTGALLAFTFNTEQKLIAWTSGTTDGFVEWLISLPAGATDKTYALVRRTINGVTKRYIEYLNWGATNGFHDSRISQTASPAKATWTGLGHLEAKTVRAHADGVFMGDFVVTAGAITLPRVASAVIVGLPLDAKIVSQAPEVGTGTGTSQGQNMSTHRIQVRLLNSIGLTIQNQDVPFRAFGPLVLDQAIPAFTGIKDITNFGWAEGESPITIEQKQGYPMTVLAIIRDMTVNPG